MAPDRDAQRTLVPERRVHPPQNQHDLVLPSLVQEAESDLLQDLLVRLQRVPVRRLDLRHPVVHLRKQQRGQSRVAGVRECLAAELEALLSVARLQDARAEQADVEAVGSRLVQPDAAETLRDGDWDVVVDEEVQDDGLVAALEGELDEALAVAGGLEVGGTAVLGDELLHEV